MKTLKYIITAIILLTACEEPLTEFRRKTCDQKCVHYYKKEKPEWKKYNQCMYDCLVEKKSQEKQTLEKND